MTTDIATQAELAAKAADEESISLMSRATEFVIADDGQYQASGGLLREIKTQQKATETARTDITGPMDEVKKKIMALFRVPSDRLKAAEATLKAAIVAFNQAEHKRLAAEQAERDRLAAVEQKRLEKRAETAAEKGDDAKAEVLEQAATQVAAPPPPPPTKAAGVHTVTTWSAELTDKMELIKAAAANPTLAPFLEADMTKLNAQARSLKGEMDIPGVRAVPTTGVSARAR